MILSRGGFAFKEHIGSNSGYIKTLLVAKIHATCFGKHGNSLAVKRINLLWCKLKQQKGSQWNGWIYGQIPHRIKVNPFRRAAWTISHRETTLTVNTFPWLLPSDTHHFSSQLCEGSSPLGLGHENPQWAAGLPSSCRAGTWSETSDWRTGEGAWSYEQSSQARSAESNTEEHKPRGLPMDGEDKFLLFSISKETAKKWHFKALLLVNMMWIISLSTEHVRRRLTTSPP